MKEITIKFESEHDYQNFIDQFIMPDVIEEGKEWLPEINTLIFKDTSIKQV